LYDKLLIGKGYEKIETKDYLESLIDSIFKIFNNCRHDISVTKNIVDFSLGVKKAIPIGIILNELLTNVCKYAFDECGNGSVLIELTKIDSLVTLIVADNGVGFGARKLANITPGFGINIVKMLVEQLDGTFTMEDNNGIKSIIEFKI